MEVRGITDYDIVNYKEPALFIAFPYCSFKCDKECGRQVCQNSSLVYELTKTVEINLLLEIYETNPLTRALVCGGLEPFDSKGSLYVLLDRFRRRTNDTIVIYTGYTEEELVDEIPRIESFGNIIIKFGRFIPDRPSRYDEILGVTLASDNQYAKYYE